jgi:hypothetical protein
MGSPVQFVRDGWPVCRSTCSFFDNLVAVRVASRQEACLGGVSCRGSSFLE